MIDVRLKNEQKGLTYKYNNDTNDVFCGSIKSALNHFNRKVQTYKGKIKTDKKHYIDVEWLFERVSR